MSVDDSSEKSINIIVGCATTEDDDSSCTSTKIPLIKKHLHLHHHYRRHHRNKNETDKVKKRHSKSRRSASITTNHCSELDQLRKNNNLTLSPNRGSSAEKADNQAGQASGQLPRTLSTSVLRIKHRRTFWERCAR